MVSLTFKRGKSPTVFIYRVGSDNALHLATAFHPVVIGKRVWHKPVHRVGYALGQALDGKTFSQATRIAKRMHWPRPIKEADPQVVAVHKP
jgi:hypothetical protein